MFLRRINPGVTVAIAIATVGVVESDDIEQRRCRRPIGSDGTLCIVMRVRIGRALVQGIESVDGIGVSASRGLEERLHAGCQLTFGCRRRIHVGGVELCDALRFVGGGDIDGVDGRRALATSRLCQQ